MRALGLAAFALLVVVFIIGGTVVLVAFKRYCTDVARLEGRLKERREVWGADENVTNAFEREQYRELLGGQYRSLNDEQLVRVGQRLSIGMWALFPLAALIIVCAVILFDN